MKEYCVIDIGTNSIRMLIAKLEGGHIIDSRKILKMTRIGEGLDKTKMISAVAIDRSIDALKKFKDEAASERINDIGVIATSAVRDALNRNEFLKRVKHELDLDVEVISGQREAELGFRGVIKGMNKKVENLLVIDIGGGSTEFILGNSEGIKYSKSLNVGAVRMTDKHVTTDPISNLEMYNLTADIREIINEVIEDIESIEIEEVVGIGGTATSLASITQGLESYDRRKIHNYELRIEEIDDMICRFKGLDNDQRRGIKGLQPKRADIILAGSNILYEILSALNVTKIKISEYDNLEGYIYSLGERK